MSNDKNNIHINYNRSVNFHKNYNSVFRQRSLKDRKKAHLLNLYFLIDYYLLDKSLS